MSLSTLNAGHYMKCTLGVYNDHRVSDSCVHCGFVPFLSCLSARNCVSTLKPTRIYYVICLADGQCYPTYTFCFLPM